MRSLIAFTLLLSACACDPPPTRSAAVPAPPKPRAAVPGYVLSGPYAHANLTVFLLHKPGIKPDATEYLTLEEALLAKTLAVTEKSTGAQVNTIEVENSGDRPVYLQAGDAVKGGQQDRTVAVDFIVPPASGKMEVGAFCVEPGRWAGREGGQRYANVFGAASAPVATREQKLAIKLAQSQSKVWDEGRKVNQDLATKSSGNADPAARESDSYVLTSEDPKVRKKTAEYTDALLKAADGKLDAVGMAFAVNGEASTVEIYSGPAIFRKLWPKLLQGAALEALSKQSGQAPERPASEDDIRALVTQASDGRAETEDLSPEVKLEAIESKQTAIFTTRVKGEVLHRQVLKK
jgi:hypothetical protein